MKRTLLYKLWEQEGRNRDAEKKKLPRGWNLQEQDTVVE